MKRFLQICLIIVGVVITLHGGLSQKDFAKASGYIQSVQTRITTAKPISQPSHHYPNSTSAFNAVSARYGADTESAVLSHLLTDAK